MNLVFQKALKKSLVILSKVDKRLILMLPKKNIEKRKDTLAKENKN